MTTLAFTGPPKHGKTTMGNIVEELEPGTLHLEFSGVISEVVDSLHSFVPEDTPINQIEWTNRWLTYLPPILKDVVHVDYSFEQLKIAEESVQENSLIYQKLFTYTHRLAGDPELSQHKITAENKQEYLDILRGLGAFLVSKDPGIWANEIARRVEVAETEGYSNSVVGGLRYPSDAAILRKIGANIAEMFRPNEPLRHSKDPTEEQRHKIIPDTKIINDGTLDNLKELAKRYLDDIHAGKPKGLYIASDM